MVLRTSAFALLLWVGCAPHAAAQDRPPNVVFILADDLGYGDLGAYGQARIRTPRLDRMAAEGIRFTNFYAGATVCAPSRSVLMTGQHTGRTTVRGNAGPDVQTLRPEDVTVAEVLRDAGYATGLVGKWGLGDEGNTGRPDEQGFDYFFGYLNQVHAHNYYPAFLWYGRDKAALPNVVAPAPRAYGGFTGGRATERGAYAHDLLVDSALVFIERHRDRPFFLYLALTIPHANNEAGDAGMEVPDLGPYAAEDWPAPERAMAAMVARMDHDVGRLLDTLRRLGLDDDTVVFFSSDNGPHREGGHDPDFFDSNGLLRGIKRDLYEGGIRVPMIAWGPGRIPEGRVSDHVGGFQDFMPTAAALAGTAPPPGRDGLSFAPTLLGRPEHQARHDYLYWEFYEQGSAQAVRSGSWKAVRRPMHTGAVELFDLSADVGETNDVAARHPGVAARLATLMDAAHVPSPHWSPPD